ncbi:hypothetical protein C2E23DRAFT_575602 [Lenzites betulinus]|nr:hypothetical protein C2E23DRAFT_575602 [Lenzites betulinus]
MYMPTHSQQAGFTTTHDRRPDIPRKTDLWEVLQKAGDISTEQQTTKAWTDIAGLVKTCSDETVDRWNKEIDTYLVYAGLFSAILTAFNVQSYLLLQPAPPDPTMLVLQQISLQLASFSVSPHFLNSTESPFSASTPVDVDPDSTPQVPRWAICLNGLWFSGLILSLSSASLGIMVKQWLNEYSSGVTGSSRYVARLRQYRLNNLQRWRIEDVVVLIPVLLQLALACFLAGLLVLLWNLHIAVASIACSLVSLLFLFTISTTILPLFDNTCAYLTPVTRALYTLWQPKRVVYRMWALSTIFTFSKNHKDTRIDEAKLSPQAGSPAPTGSRTGQQWKRAVQSLYSKTRGIPNVAPLKSWKDPNLSWSGRERSTISHRNVAQQLDLQTLVEAYSSTLHPDTFSSVFTCLSGPGSDFRAPDVLNYFRLLHRSVRDHFGPTADLEGDGAFASTNQHPLLWTYVLLALLYSGDACALSGEEKVALSVYMKWGYWPSGMRAAEGQWAIAALSTILGCIEDGESPALAPFSDSFKNVLRVKIESLRVRCRIDGISLGNGLRVLVSQAYRRVRVRGLCLAEPPPETIRDAYTSYMQSVREFLACVDGILRGSPPPDDLEFIRHYAADVANDLVATLTRLLDEENIQHIWGTADVGALSGVIEQLACEVSDGLLLCIPATLLPALRRVADGLASISDYGCIEGETIQVLRRRARRLKLRLALVGKMPRIDSLPHTLLRDPSIIETSDSRDTPPLSDNLATDEQLTIVK